MPLDYMMTGAIVRELGEKLTGAKADKIYMPQKDRVVISLHGQGGKNLRLYSIQSREGIVPCLT